MREPNPGDAALLVLAAIARGSRFGFDIMDETGLKSGSVYRALSRLEDAFGDAFGGSVTLVDIEKLDTFR